MTDIKPVGLAAANLTGMRLQIVHAILYSIQAKELLALKAKSHLLKEEGNSYFKSIAEEAKKRNESSEQALQLDVFIALSKLLKLPAARLNEKEKVTARAEEIGNKWFDRKAKKDKSIEERFEASLLTNKLEFMLHYEYVQLLERFLKNEKVDKEKEPLQESIRHYWEQLPAYRKVQIFEHLKISREATFEELVAEAGTAALLFEMGTRSGLAMYRNIFPSIQEDIPKGLPKELWILHPNAVFTPDEAIKTLFLGNWSLPAAMLLLYAPDESVQKADESILASEWMARESAYLLLLRQINELKVEQQQEEKQIAQIKKELASAESAEERARAVYHSLRERLIVLLKTDPARPYLGDISVTNTRLREKFLRVTGKMESNKSRTGVLKATSAWLSNVYLQAEKNTLEKKLQSSYEKMADEVMEKYPYYEADLISELVTARANANEWESECSRLRKKDAETAKSLSEIRSEELKLREKAAESASKTPGLKQIGTGEAIERSPIA
ncbi:hypothetical protein [Domibacillus indicus]|uniref:hypothetical protein n=1 Tax=Domibacillus indicus TaxID=1437523 RepID=UPI000617E8D7|nr:hypothetical protein [Domibacillus indicus]